ncbi:SIS domain-containing protein [Vagococcus elongatus]|uniref:SIS domain-containing protein n=1 Tax=Vagococcus elongatus TaxID=180344 RepID=A0A430B135_9ENTE|nr:SIS domain-containing protein [Vagococcus elongatus]RSU14009.1 hypothetical protein CBF29_03755 [Vagococcus elongatus]
MFKNFISLYEKEYISALENLEKHPLEELLKIIEEAISQEKNIFVLGNGGSSASASHWVCDFNKGVSFNKRELKTRFFSLTDNIPIITAYGNDVSYDEIFVEQLKNLINKGDVLISLSVSGNSKNLVRAQDYVQSQGLKTVCITNNKPNLLKRNANLTISIPSENYGIVEDCHMYICHVLSQYISQR